MRKRVVTAGLGGYLLARRVARRSGASDLDLNLELPGDELIDDAVYVADRVTTYEAPIDQVWPWIAQLGKARGGWYMPHWLEEIVVRKKSSRSLRHIADEFQHLAVGDEVPDYGPGEPTFEVMQIDSPHFVVFRSIRDKPRPNEMSWALVLTEISPWETKLHIRLRVRRNGAARLRALWLPPIGVFDYVTIAMVFAGLRQRIRAS